MADNERNEHAEDRAADAQANQNLEGRESSSLPQDMQNGAQNATSSLERDEQELE